MSPAHVTPKMEDYLRGIYLLGADADGWVSNTALARRLDVTRASVTSMLERLSDRGLVDRQRYQPVRLTADGERRALRVVRNHRLVELLLFERFDYGIEAVDAEADVLEHHISARLCRAIERELGMPTTDPHGDPIPDADLAISRTDHGTPLTEISASTEVRISRILTQDTETLGYLDSAGIQPTARLRVDNSTPIGTVTVIPADAHEELSLPNNIASHILVEPAET